MTIPSGSVVHGDAQTSIVLLSHDQRAREVQRCLQAFYQSTAATRPAPQVTGVANITSGMEHEMYAFDLEHGCATELQREQLVLRIYSGDDARRFAEREFRVLQRLYDASYPVPRVHILEQRTSLIGNAFVIMERFEGEVFGQRFSRAAPSEYPALCQRFCELMVRLHEVDWRPFSDLLEGDYTEGPYVVVDGVLAHERKIIQQHSLGSLLPIVDWLQQRKAEVPCLQPSLTHGDLHFNNVLIRDDGSVTVIDWTHFCILDRRMDLAWTLVLHETHASVELRNGILAAYQSVTGIEVQQLEWFETLACLWKLRHFTMLLSQGGEKMGMHAQALAVAKQQIGANALVYNLLRKRTGIHIPEVEHFIETTN